MNTGFSVTVFKDPVGNLTVAFRGVNDLGDLSTALDIHGSGAAYEQIVAMANWWARVSAPEGDVQQFRLTSYSVDSIPVDAVVLRSDDQFTFVLEVAAPAAAFTDERNISAALLADPDGRVDLAGQSLGGHLSLAFSSLFAASTGQVTVFNTPGFINNDVNQAFFSKLKLGATIPTGSIPTGSVVNVAADEALVDDSAFNWIAGMHSRPGAWIDIAIEDQIGSDEPFPFDSKNHALETLTDSLAVYKLLADLAPASGDNAFTTADYKRILNQAVQGTAAGYERIVDTLQKLFTNDSKLLETSNGNREALYQAIRDLTKTDSVYASKIGQLKIEAVTGVAGDFVTHAQTNDPRGLAWRYTLKALDPFAVIDASNTGVYAKFQVGGSNAGELDLYDPTSRTGTLTTQWLEDRAGLLQRRLDIATKDEINDIDKPLDLNNTTTTWAADNLYFEDRTTGYIVNQGGQRIHDPYIIFGTDGTDGIVGSSRDDHLYGEAGTDILRGNAGNDYLEGGSGFDLYQYGASKSLLGIPSNDGADMIWDVDGKGVLRYSFTQGGATTSTVIADALIKDGNFWMSADGKFKYEKPGADLVVTILDDAGGSITLKDFRDGDFGIRLWEAHIAPEFAATANVVAGGDEEANTLTGTAAADLIQALGGNDSVNAGAGDDIVEGDDGADTLNGEADHDRLFGGAGRDEIDGGTGNDEAYGGAEADIVQGRAGADQLAGQVGADVVAGDDGDDEVYADEVVTLTVALTQAESQTGSGLKGDWVDGGEGNDIVVGGVDNDQLMGGGGADILIGGAGDDNLVGDLGRTLVHIDNWMVTRETIQSAGAVTHQLSYNADAQVAVSANGARDMLYGGAGSDWIFGGAGDDFIDGGSGGDIAFGEAGSDVLIGGAGNDILVGDNPGVVAAADEGGDYLDGGAGDDQLFGNGGADILIGGPGADILVGGAGKDIYVFNKGDGTETVFDTPASASDPNASVLVVGDGINRSDIKFRTGSLMVDFGGGDAIHFEDFDQLNPANSPVIGEIRFADGTSMSYADILAQGFDIDGTEEDDDDHDAAHPQLNGTGVTDRIRGFGGNDIIAGLAGDDILDGGAGNDVIVGGAGADTLIGGIGFDQLQGGSGNDDLQGGDDDDVLFGDADDATEETSGDDVLRGGTGRDQLLGNSGNDTLYGDDGDDPLLAGQWGSDIIEGGAGNDFLYGDGIYEFQGEFFVNLFDDGASDILRGGDGDDQLDAGAGDDVLDGGAGADTLFAGAGNDVLSGGDGNDQLVGDGGDDQLGGGSGDDTLLGEAGNDSYLFNLGNGRDLIVEDSAINTEVLRFGAGIVLEDLTFSRTAGDLLISHANGIDEVTIANWCGGVGFQMTRLEFADGSVLSGADAGNRGLQLQRGTEGNDTLVGTTGNDTLFGLGGNDTIFGNGGSDTLTGGSGSDALNASSGNDTFQFASGDGADAITDAGGSDALIFGAGIIKAEIMPSRAGGDLVLTRTASSDTVTIRDWFNSLSNKIESITFAGTGEAFTDTDLITPFLMFNGTATADTFAGGAYNETFSGLGDNDFIQAGGGGDDITGGTGNDNLFGDAGFDTFHFALGDGQDTVNDSDGFGVVHFGSDLVDKVVFTSVSGGRLVTFTGTSDSVLIKDPTISTFNRVQTKFDILGTSANNTIVGTSFNEVIQGLGGVDSINGGDGADEIFGGDGNDILEGGGSDTDSSRDSLFGGAGDDILDSGLRTGAGDVGGSLTGGPGNDQLFGSSGTDRYFFNLGDGQDIINDEFLFANGQTLSSPEDEVIFGPGISADMLSGSRSGNDLIVSISPTDRITIKNQFSGANAIERFTFADGSPLSHAEINALQFVKRGTSGNDILTGGDPAENLFGLAGNDTLQGMGGNDTLDGGTGNDLLMGGAGNDLYVFRAGDGQDRITENSGIDTVQFGLGSSASNITLGRDINSLMLSVNGTSDSVTITDYLSNPDFRVESFVFADGSQLPSEAQILDQLANVRGTPGDDTLVGTAGFDALFGFEGNDTLIGGTGNDSLLGDDGDDVYQYAVGDGQDTINDTAGFDSVVFGSGIATTAVTTTRSATDLFLNVNVTGSPGAITVQNYFAGQETEQIRFADGTTWDVATVRARVLAASQTAGNDTIFGYESDDAINALAGNDTVFGGAGNDTIDGGTGSDTLHGEDGDDILIAGGGDANKATVFNVLFGGAGNDILIASAKLDNLFGGAGNDVYRGGAAINLLEDSAGNNAMDALAGNDTLRGGDQNDAFIGGAGNDAIDGDFDGNGARGSDIVLFNKGAGVDTVMRLGSGSTLSMGGGMLYSNLAFSVSGNTLTVSAGTGTVSFTDWYSGNKAVSRLQIVIEGTRNYSATSTNPMNNQKIQTFDFLPLVAAFDAARAAGQTFKVADNLPTYRLSGSDTDAIGGAIAYQYGRNGAINSITDTQLQAILGSASFGVEAQPISATAPQLLQPASPEAGAVDSESGAPLTSIAWAPTQEASDITTSASGASPSGTDALQTEPVGTEVFSRRDDPLKEKLDDLIEAWFDETRYRQAYDLSGFDPVTGAASAGFGPSGSLAANAAQWTRIARRLPLHLAQYADGGLDLHEGAFSDAFGTSFFGGGTPMVNAVGLFAVPSNSLKDFQGLQEGLTRLA